MKLSKYWILVILVFSLAGKWLGWMTLDDSRLLAGDSYRYHQLALGLLSRGSFSLETGNGTAVETYRTPGYPAFLAAIYACFGPHLAPVVGLQILLSLGTIFLTAWIGSRIWSEPVGVLAALLLALDVSSYAFTFPLLTETLFTFVLTGALLVGLKVFHHGGWAWSLWMGLLLGGAALVRPIGYFLIVPVLLALLGVCKWQGWTWKRTGNTAAALFLGFSLLVAGWQSRNYRVTGSGEFATVSGVVLLFYRGAAVLALKEGITFQEARSRLGMENYQTLHPETAGWTQQQLHRRWKEEGLRIIFHHPVLYAQVVARGTAATLLNPGTVQALALFDQPRRTFDLVRGFFDSPFESARESFLLAFFLATAGYLILIYTGIAGWWMAVLGGQDRKRVHVLFWGVALYLVLIAAGPTAGPRVRVPVMPMLALYAAAGLNLSWQRWGGSFGRSRPS